MNQIKSTDIEKITLDDSFYTEISSMVSSKKKKETMRRSIAILIIALGALGFAVVIYAIVYISRIKSEKADLVALVEKMKGELEQMSAKHTMLTDKLRQREEDYMLLDHKFEKQTEYYGQIEKANEMQLADVMNKEVDLKKKVEELSADNQKFQADKLELKEIIKNLAIKVEEQAKKEDVSLYKKIKTALRKIKKKVKELFPSI